MPNHTAFVGLGSNLDDPESQIRRALAALGRLPLTRLLAPSSLYRSAPVGYSGQPDFINAVAEVQTGLAPRALLEALQAIEQAHGRKRAFRNAPRTLDLDLLLYDDAAISEPGLDVPHPRMHERAFVLAPLTEIAPGCAIPGKGPAADWLLRCGGQTTERISTA